MTSYPLASTSPLALQFVLLLDWLPSRVAYDFCNPDNPDALGNDSSFFVVTQQQRRFKLQFPILKTVFTCTKFLLKSVTKQVIGPRIPRCWHEHLDDKKLGWRGYGRNRKLGFARSL